MKKRRKVRDNVMPEPSYQEWQREVQEKAYKCVLEHVVNVAKRCVSSGVFESTGVAIRGLVATKALTRDTLREAFATRTQERDFKIGAAGELYMFEYLKGLGLPRFGLENWKSEIRDRVKLHTDYHDLEKVNDRSAIADIEYLDESGKLTRFLDPAGTSSTRFVGRRETFLSHRGQDNNEFRLARAFLHE